MGRVGDLMLLNLICLVCCLPIITIGASLTSLYYVTMKMVRDEESYLIKSFFKSFKDNFKQSAIINLIILVAGGILFLDFQIISQLPGFAGKALFVFFSMIAIFLFMEYLYVYPVLAKFYNTVAGTMKVALLMSIRHLPQTGLMLVISAVPLAFFFIPDAKIQSLFLMVLFLFGGASIAYINSIFFVKIFDKYIPENTSADIPEHIPGASLPDSGITPTAAVKDDAADDALNGSQEEGSNA